MITKIVLENFMSHSKTVIEPAACLTVLTGPNNCGKSAVVAALQTICGNERGSFMVRHGQKESRVVIETDEGHGVEWRRKGATVSYVVNEREVHRGVPEDLHDVLRLPKVESREGKDEFDVHFGEQKRPIFLVGEPGSQAATFFASSSDAEYLVRMQSLHRQRTTERRGKERDLKQGIARLDQSLKVLSPLDTLAERMASVEALHAECVGGAESIASLALRLEELKNLVAKHAVSEAGYRCLESLAEPPEQADLPGLSGMLQELAVSHHGEEEARVRAAALLPLTDPPELCPDRQLQDDVETLARLKTQSRVLGRRSNALDALSLVPELADEAALEGAIAEIRVAERGERAMAGRFEAVDRLAEPPNLADEAALESVLGAVRDADAARTTTLLRASRLEVLPELPDQVDVSQADQAVKELREAERALAEAAEALGKIQEAAQAVRTDIEIWVALNPTCPVCGGDFDSSRILGEPEAAVG